jgi:hypothetical protein
MKLEVGKYYKTRDGRCVLITRGNNLLRPIQGRVEGHGWDSWKDDGRYSTRPEEDYGLDIVSEWPREDVVPIDLDSVFESEPKPIATTPEPDYWEKLRHQAAVTCLNMYPEVDPVNAAIGASERASALIEELRKKR